MKWIWVRHGETDANQRGCYLGHLDIPLTVSGKEQIRTIAETLSCEKATRLYSSDLTRCAETAGVIGQAVSLQPELEPRLRELNFGQWDGKTYDEIMRLDQPRVTEWYRNPMSVSTPCGESLSQLGQRVDQWIQSVLPTIGAHEVVIIVSHGGVIRWFQSRWLLGDASTYWQVQSVPLGGMLAVTDVSMKLMKPHS